MFMLHFIVHVMVHAFTDTSPVVQCMLLLALHSSHMWRM